MEIKNFFVKFINVIISKYKNKKLLKFIVWKLGLTRLVIFFQNPLIISRNYLLNNILKLLKPLIKNPANYVKFKFKILTLIKSDINEHLRILSIYANRCNSIFETGVRGVVSSWALLHGLNESKQKSKIFVMNDIESCDVEEILSISKKLNIKSKFILGNNLKIDMEESFDLTFIDTWHVYGQLKRELEKFSKYTKKYIILHDTTLDGDVGESIRTNMDISNQVIESGFEEFEIRMGLQPAINEFLKNNQNWDLLKKYENNNGLTILARV